MTARALPAPMHDRQPQRRYGAHSLPACGGGVSKARVQRGAASKVRPWRTNPGTETRKTATGLQGENQRNGPQQPQQEQHGPCGSVSPCLPVRSPKDEGGTGTVLGVPENPKILDYSRSSYSKGGLREYASNQVLNK